MNPHSTTAKTVFGIPNNARGTNPARSGVIGGGVRLFCSRAASQTFTGRGATLTFCSLIRSRSQKAMGLFLDEKAFKPGIEELNALNLSAVT